MRLLAYTLGIVAVVTLGAALFVYLIQRREVRAADEMMEDALRLQIGESSLKDVLAFARKYNGNATGSWHNNPCLESDCLVTAAPNSDFWTRHPKLGDAAHRVWRRGWHLVILLWVKDGKLDAMEQWFTYSTPRGNYWITATLSRPGRGLCRVPSYRLHHAFAAYPGPKDFKVWVSPTATHEREMLRLDVGCVLRLFGCKDVADMAPSAWGVYEADQLVIKANEGKWRNEIATEPDCR